MVSCTSIPQNDEETFDHLLKSGKSQAHVVKLLSSRVNFAKSCSAARLATRSYTRIEVFLITRWVAEHCVAEHYVRILVFTISRSSTLLRNAT